MMLSRRSLISAGGAAAAAAVLPLDRALAAAQAEWALAVRNVPGDLAPRALSLIHGRPPAGLAGTLYRNGPAQFTRGASRTHWFDGDGFVRAFEIRDGRATLAGRFVDTPKRRTEAAAGAMVVPGFGNPGSPATGFSGPDDLNAANTSMLAVGGKLWALWEGGSPTAIDPATLETRGFVRLRDDLKGVPFLAHPRVEPGGRVWNLGLFGSRAIVWRLSSAGELEAATPTELPYASYVHDFTATDRELVIVLQPWVRGTFSTPIVDSLQWKPELGTRVLVIDKDDLSRRRVYELPALSFFHLGDAWREADGTIRFDGCFGTDDTHIRGDVSRLTAGQTFHAKPARAAMIALGPDGRARIDWTASLAEFPQADRRRAGLPRTRTWHVAGDGKWPLPTAIAVTDWARQKTDRFGFDGQHLMEEGLFVPRGASSAEGDGWLVGTSLNLRARVTELHVFDALRLADGPVCSWRADVPLPVGFHGAFVRV
jgi:all-trans-8'-apo-beta-carotenal 15,15'-oxygenase